jgi:hypothetical protein
MTVPRAIEISDERPHALTEFFDGLRQSRRERRQPRGSRSAAVLTIVRDEAVFLPIWLRYYSQHFSPEDIYVLDHGSSDGSTDRGGFVRIPVEHETIDHTWMRDTVAAQQRKLLEQYDVVVSVDCDEIIVPDPAWGTLSDYVSGFSEDFVNCLGYEVIHLPDREPSLDLEGPLLQQRHYWFAADGYDKPAVATSPSEWEVGFHSLADGRLNLDPDLRLIHLHRLDYGLCRDRHLTRRQARWQDTDLDAGWASHNRLVDGAGFDDWYYRRSTFEATRGFIVERIPDRWRGAL